MTFPTVDYPCEDFITSTCLDATGASLNAVWLGFVM